MSFWAKNARTTTIRIGKAALLKKRLIKGGIPGWAGLPSLPSPHRPDRRFSLALKCCDVRQVAITLGEIEPVADREPVRDLEADVPRDHLDLAPLGLGEQRADLQRARIAGPQVAHQVLQRQAGVDDVLDDQDV